MIFSLHSILFLVSNKLETSVQGHSPVVVPECLHQCPGKAGVHRGDNTLVCDGTVEDQLDG
jgi:hypothetical protein